jgi:hypothetical protein
MLVVESKTLVHDRVCLKRGENFQLGQQNDEEFTVIE